MTLNSGNIVRLNRRPAAAAADHAAAMDDKDLYLHLLTPVKKHLYNFIRKALNFSHDADDVFQETLLKAFRYFHSYRRDKSFKTWIFTIAHNLVKDHFRRGRSLEPMEDMDAVAVVNDAAVPQDVKDIYGLAGRLKPRQREVFFLYYYNEFKVPEIVEITGLTKANVKYSLHQARKAVQKMAEAPQ